MMPSRSRWVALAALVAAGASGCGHEGAETAPARPVHVERVAGQSAASGYRYTATIQPHEQVAVAFKTSGYVSGLLQRRDADGTLRSVQQGDVVRRGTVLARVDPADHSERVNQANASLEEAASGLVRARADAERADKLYAEKAMTRPDYDAARANLAAAEARARGARAQLQSMNLSLRDATLVAPNDGVVLARRIEVGTLAQPGVEAFTIADLSRVKAVFGVPDQVVPLVPVGTPLEVRCDALGAASFPGRVTAVSPSADAQSRVFNVEVTIANADGRLKAGMIASVQVAAEGRPEIAAGAPTVSVSAVVKAGRPGAFAVFLAEGPDDGATARRRDVGLGRISGNRVAVDTGLAVGDRVIVSGASLIVDGERVRVIPGQEGR
jgi:multidrug efflux system membrane fusion protein